MIPRLASPSVCVIDDEKCDYEPILNALHRLGLGCVHIKGEASVTLRQKPMNGLRVVFTDLHLSGQVGKAAASHTANVFKRVVSAETAPVVVVIWSKYADDPVPGNGLPSDDQPTEAAMFKQTLLEAEPAFKDRLVFCEMKKPKLKNRPKGQKWITKLQKDIRKEIEEYTAFDVLWTWESIVREAGIRLTQSLTMLAMEPPAAQPNGTASADSLHDRLKVALRVLVREQGGPNPSAASAPRHLATVLAQTLADHIEHSEDLKVLAKHGEWLSIQSGTKDVCSIAPGVNGLLLTAGPSVTTAFTPGTVYRFANAERFRNLFGMGAADFINLCVPMKAGANRGGEEPTPILLEISPACDVHQGHRRRALLIAGAVVPMSACKNAKRDGAFDVLPVIRLRWDGGDFAKQDAVLVFCSRFKTTMDPKKEPRWLTPWFRLRELPTAALRNWHSAHASRVGYVALRL